MTQREDKPLGKKMRPETERGEPMDHSNGTVGQKIGRAARAFEKQRTKHGRKWMTVFLNEETIVIALHGSLTATEKTLAQEPEGARQVREFHRCLFTDNSKILFQQITSITGMEVREATAEIDLRTGGAIQFFTTNTAAGEFLLPRTESSDIRVPRSNLSRREDDRTRRDAEKTGCFIR